MNTIEYEQKSHNWLVTCEPHVMMRAKRVFGKVSSASMGQYRLSDTRENARDLEWFCSRYPFELDEETAARLRSRSSEHRDEEALVKTLLANRADLPPFDLALPAREYQRVAAAMALGTGGLLLADEVGLGKEQPVDAKVLTPTGWREIGLLQVGDLVIGSTGSPILVRAVHPQGVKSAYRLTFSDGSSVEAGAEHLWALSYVGRQPERHQTLLTTKQLHEKAVIIKKWPNGTVGHMSIAKTRLYLPVLSSPVEFASCAPLPIEPYVLGQLIANGYLTSGCATLVTNTEDWPEVRSRLLATCALSNEWAHTGSIRVNILKLIGVARALGIARKSSEKRIPPVYKLSSVENRIALLHGLMDADGSCSATRNRVMYSTTSPGLAEDVRELVEQLGGIATVRRYDRTSEEKPIEFQVRVRLPLSIPPFSIHRKLSRLAAERRVPQRTLSSVEYSRTVESVCISVDAEDGLYVTECCILTHNTASAICTFTDPTTLPALVVTLTHLPRQWEAEINRFAPNLRTHIVKKGTPYDLTKPDGRKRKGVEALPFPDVLIMNYAKLHGWAETLAPIVRSVVFDECQELRTGPGTSKYSGAEHVSRNARLRLGCSATPIFNYGGEIWNVINVLRPGVVGARHEFDREWGRHLARDNVALNDPRAFGYYARETGIMLRRTRRDVGRELPPLSNISQPVEADERALDSVSDACAELARAILAQGERHRGEKWMASEDFSNTLRQATGIAKAPFVAEFVKMLVESGERVLLFGWHHAVYDIWRDRLAALKPVMFTGTETESVKHRSLEAFKSGEARVLIMSLRSGAGVDGLQHCCRTVVYGELDWSPMVHEQCSGRVSRDGQPDPVMAYYLVSEHGADPIMADVLGLKRQQSEGFLDPDRPLVVPVNVDPSHVRRLAVDYLERKGIPIPKEEPCDHSPSPAGSENSESAKIQSAPSQETCSTTRSGRVFARWRRA